MSQQEIMTDLCKKCYIKINKPTKNEIKKLVMSEEKYQCNCCHKTEFIVEYVED
jgi:hypothetical protein